MKEEPINTKRVKALVILTIIIFINLFSLFYWIDSEINKLCQPSERYNMAESYRPGGEYKSTTGDNSVAIIWQIESVKINKYIVERFNGFGEGFIEPETLWGN